VIVHAGSGAVSKNWPLDRFRACADAFRSDGRRVAWLTGPADKAIRVGVDSAATSDERLESPTLESLVDRLSSCGLFVGNDSGPAHLAAACGAPTIVLYGPTDPRVWRPDGPRVTALRAPSGRLDDVAVEQVLSAAEALLKRPA
jgi:ADP-heptose:LPS heptosyltransferase